MRIFLLGATGQTGLIFLKDALKRGHNVTAFVRSPDKISFVHEQLDIMKGDLLSPKSMSSAMVDHDVVISCLGGNDNVKAMIITDLIKTIVSSMKKNHIKRIYADNLEVYTYQKRLFNRESFITGRKK